jgi:hypothetical protein
MQWRLVEAIRSIGIREVTQQKSCHIEVTTPDGIMQRSVCLSVVAANAGAGTSAKKKVNDLEAVRASNKPGTSHGELQWVLAAPLQTCAARIDLCIELGLAVKQQSDGAHVSLPNSLVQGVLALAAGMSALQGRAQQRHRLLLDRLVDVLLYLLRLLPRARTQRRTDCYDLGWRRRAKWKRSRQ